MTTCPLGDAIASNRTGFASGKRATDGVVQLRMNNVRTDGTLDLSSVIRVPASKKQVSDLSLTKGDVLFNSTNSPELVGKTCLFKGFAEPVVFSNHFVRLRTRPERLRGDYLARWLTWMRDRGVFTHGRIKWVNQATFRTDDLFRLRIPLPPLAEQKRIAEILDAADALRAKRCEALAQLDTLPESTFLDMFGDPVTNPMGWAMTTIRGIGRIQGGLQVTAKRRSLPIERPYLRVANVFRGFLELDELKTIRLTQAEERRTTLESGDILIVEGHGNKEEIGRCARWDGSIAQCVHQNHLIRLRCNRSIASPVYVEHYINSPGGRRSLAGTSRTTSGLNTISVSKVGASGIQLPPLDLQHQFAAIAESVERQRARQRAHLAELVTLFASLQSRAFRGEL